MIGQAFFERPLSKSDWAVLTCQFPIKKWARRVNFFD